MPHLDQTTVEAAIERALAPLKGLFPPQSIEKMREELREYATTHPYPVGLLRAMGDEPAVHRSGPREVGEDGDDAESAAPEAVGRARGRAR
jgi:hypothetical protein